MDKCEIPYSTNDAYDDWDNIASMLYESMILSPLRFSEGQTLESGVFTKYDLQYESYTDLIFIAINYDDFSNHINVFLSFEVQANIEHINVCLIDATTLMPLQHRKMKYSEANFSVYKKLR